MRTMMLGLTLGIMATLAYLRGPELLQELKLSEAVESGETQAAPSVDETPSLSDRVESALNGQTKADDEALKASLGHLRQTVPGQKKRVLKIRRVKRKKNQAQVDLPAAPKLAAVRPGAQKGKNRQAALAKTEIVKHLKQPEHWIGSLSGEKVAIKMGRAKTSRDCRFQDCDDRNRAKDALLVGTVMKTQKLVESPHQPFEGRWTKGHYNQATPAVYYE